MKHILVTGGAGYIGSHVVLELVQAGYEPIIIDNFNNSTKESVEHLEKLSERSLIYYQGDYQDANLIGEIITKHAVDGVIHIAAYKAVGESVEQPLKYYQNNVTGFVTLLQTLLINGINNIVFSSSAAVYGTPEVENVTEEVTPRPESPYGWSKYMDEIVLRDVCRANPTFKGIALRYFNVVGSHESVMIGESPKGKPQNLLPIMVQAVAQQKPFTVYGTDYPTPDGTCLRDYIHVVDLAKAHVAALGHLNDPGKSNYRVYNLGTGKPTSVLELLHTFEKVNDVQVPHILGDRRLGDPVAYYAIADKAEHELDWHAHYTIEDAVKSAWQWHEHITKEK